MASRRLTDLLRNDQARRRREQRVAAHPLPAALDSDGDGDGDGDEVCSP